MCTIPTHEAGQGDEHVEEQEQVDEHVEEQEQVEELVKEPEQDVLEADDHDVPEAEHDATAPEQHYAIELEGEIELNEEPIVSSSRKRKRVPTMMRDLAKDPNSRVHVDFTFMGEAYGPGSVKLSSYLGPLVREHMPVTLESWKNLTEDAKTVLWKSVQVTLSLQVSF